MPRSYTLDTRKRKYEDFTDHDLHKTTANSKDGRSQALASKKCNIYRDTVQNHMKGLCTKLVGHATTLSSDVEIVVVKKNLSSY